MRVEQRIRHPRDIFRPLCALLNHGCLGIVSKTRTSMVKMLRFILMDDGPPVLGCTHAAPLFRNGSHGSRCALLRAAFDTTNTGRLTRKAL